MAFDSYKIMVFAKKIADLPRFPNAALGLTYQDLQNWWDSSPEELRISVNGIIDELDLVLPTLSTDILEDANAYTDLVAANFVLGIVADGSISRSKLSTAVQAELDQVTDTVSYITPSSVVGQLINITTLSNNPRIPLKISTTVTGGNITIKRNGGSTKNLLNVDGSSVTELSQETMYFEVVEEASNFTLRPSGGLKSFFGDGSDGTIPDLNTITTAPNGGTVANLWDMSTGTVFTTGSLSSAANQVVFQIDFGSPQFLTNGSNIWTGFKLWVASLSTGVARTLVNEHSVDGITWVTGGSVSLTTTPTDSILQADNSSFRYWRLNLRSGGSACTVSIQGLTMNFVTGDAQTTKVWRIIEPSTLNGAAVVKQYTQYTLPVGYEHTTQNPCQGLIIYSQGDAVVNGVIDLSQKAGLAPNGNPIPMVIVPEYVQTAKTSSLLHFDNNVTDANGRVWTNNGGATFDATNKKFGTHAISFNGTSRWVDTPASDDFSFGNEDFTIECQIRRTSVGGNQYIYAQNADGFNNPNVALYFGTDNVVRFIWGSLTFVSSIAITDIVNFKHYEVSRYNGILKIFVDGTPVFSGLAENPPVFTFAGAKTGLQSKFTIGRAGEWASGYFAGQIDEFRIVKGKAMYTANFTPPTAAYTYEATIVDTIEAFKEYYQLTTKLQTLRGGYGGNGGYGGGYSGAAGRQASVGIGGAGRQNLGGFGGGGSGGSLFEGSSQRLGMVGGSIDSSELGGGKAFSQTHVTNGTASVISLGVAWCGAGGRGSSYSSVTGARTVQGGGNCLGGGGGGSGAMYDANNTVGSDGQYSGGFILIICKGNFSNTGIIKANGGNGGNGSAAVGGNTGGGGAGGGAGGGVIEVLYKGTYSNTGTIQVNGGAGGTGGALNGTGEAGGSGTSGSVGIISIQQL